MWRDAKRGRIREGGKGKNARGTHAWRVEIGKVVGIPLNVAKRMTICRDKGGKVRRAAEWLFVLKQHRVLSPSKDGERDGKAKFAARAKVRWVTGPRRSLLCRPNLWVRCRPTNELARLPRQPRAREKKVWPGGEGGKGRPVGSKLPKTSTDQRYREVEFPNFTLASDVRLVAIRKRTMQ